MVGRTKKLCSGRRWGAHIRHMRYNHSHAAVKKGAVRPDPSEAWENRKQSSYEICCTVMDVVGPFPVLISSVICFRMMIKWRAIHLVSDDIRGCHCTFSSTWSWKLLYFANFAVKLSIRRIQHILDRGHGAMSFTFHHILLQAWIHRHRALVAVDRLSSVHHSPCQASHGALAVGAIHLHCVPADDMEYSRVARWHISCYRSAWLYECY